MLCVLHRIESSVVFLFDEMGAQLAAVGWARVDCTRAMWHRSNPKINNTVIKHTWRRICFAGQHVFFREANFSVEPTSWVEFCWFTGKIIRRRSRGEPQIQRDRSSDRAYWPNLWSFVRFQLKWHLNPTRRRHPPGSPITNRWGLRNSQISQHHGTNGSAPCD